MVNKLYDALKPLVPQETALYCVTTRLCSRHREDVLKVYGDYPHAVQEPQLGTGHAVAVAKDFFQDYDGPVHVWMGIKDGRGGSLWPR